jgi:hypothetical protein
MGKDFDCWKIVCRKNVIQCIEVAKELNALGLDFVWFIAGGGDQNR